MALDAGIAALQLLYRLAKLIKETRDNVVFIHEKLDGTESIAKLIEMNLERVETELCPIYIIQGIKARFTAAKRTARKLKLKYEPLLQLISSLGGNATLVKAQAAIMRKGVLGVTMAVGSVSVMLWRRVQRTNQKLQQSLFEALQDCDIPLEDYEGLSIAAVIKKLRESPSASLLGLTTLDEWVSGAHSLLADKPEQLRQLLQLKSEQLTSLVAQRIQRTKSTVSHGLSTAKALIRDPRHSSSTSPGSSEQQQFLPLSSEKIESDAEEELISPANTRLQRKASELKTLVLDTSGQLKTLLTNAIGNVGDGIHHASRAITDQLLEKIIAERPPSHLEILEANGYDLMHFEKEYQSNEWLRSILEQVDHLNQELRCLNADMKTYDVDDEEIDAGDELIPEVQKKASRDRKTLMGEGIELLIAHWFPSPSSSSSSVLSATDPPPANLSELLQEEESTVKGITEESFAEALTADLMRPTHKDQSKITPTTTNSNTPPRMITKKELQRLLGKGGTKANVNLLWRFLRRTEERLAEGFSFPSFASVLSNTLEKSSMLITWGGGSRFKRWFGRKEETPLPPLAMRPSLTVGNLPELKEEEGEEERGDEASRRDNTLLLEGEEEVVISSEATSQKSQKKSSQPELFVNPSLDSSPSFSTLLPNTSSTRSQSGKKFGFTDSSSSLLSLEEQQAEETISLATFRRFIRESAKKNLGLCLSALVLCLLKLLDHPELPGVVKDAFLIVQQLLLPLIGYTGSFGLLVAIEDVRDYVHEDPEEILAMEAEADEEALERRLALVQAFATDFQESFEHGFAPDPSLMMSIAVEVSTSFVGLGPTTKRRLAILQSILGLSSIEEDKKKIDKVDHDLKAEIIVIQSLPRQALEVKTNPQQLIQLEQLEQLRKEQSTALDKHAALIQHLHEGLKHSFDVRKLLGETGEVGAFWVQNFGKECYEVHEKRFYAALLRSYEKLSDSDWKKVRMMVLDTRGMVTAVQLQQFVGKDGSLKKVLEKLKKKTRVPRYLTALQDKEPDKTQQSIKVMASSEKSDAESVKTREDLSSEGMALTALTNETDQKQEEEADQTAPIVMIDELIPPLPASSSSTTASSEKRRRGEGPQKLRRLVAESRDPTTSTALLSQDRPRPAALSDRETASFAASSSALSISSVSSSWDSRFVVERSLSSKDEHRTRTTPTTSSRSSQRTRSVYLQHLPAVVSEKKKKTTGTERRHARLRLYEPLFK